MLSQYSMSNRGSFRLRSLHEINGEEECGETKPTNDEKRGSCFAFFDFRGESRATLLAGGILHLANLSPSILVSALIH